MEAVAAANFDDVGYKTGPLMAGKVLVSAGNYCRKTAENKKTETHPNTKILHISKMIATTENLVKICEK